MTVILSSFFEKVTNYCVLKTDIGQKRG